MIKIKDFIQLTPRIDNGDDRSIMIKISEINSIEQYTEGAAIQIGNKFIDVKESYSSIVEAIVITLD